MTKSKDLPHEGDRVRLVKWDLEDDGKYDDVVPPGSLGTVRHCYLQGDLIGVNWDNGSQLNILHKFDQWELAND